MSTNTTNYNLVKPDGTEGGDFVDVNVLNANMDIIDAQMKLTSDRPYAVLTKSVPQAVAANTNTVVTFDTLEENNGGFSITSGKLILPAAGIYAVSSDLQFADGTPGIGGLWINCNTRTACQNSFNLTVIRNEFNAANVACSAFVGALSEAVSVNLRVSSACDVDQHWGTEGSGITKLSIFQVCAL